MRADPVARARARLTPRARARLTPRARARLAARARARLTLPGLALLVALALAACGDGEAARRPASSTLEATLVDPDGDGALARGPGEPLIDRGPAARPGEVLATLAQISDAHVRDEESPGRVPFLDRLGAPFNSTFRPHEALSAQVLLASVRAVNRLGPDAVVATGDIVDSAAQVELDQALAVLDGGSVEPDTGARGYDGVQDAGQPDALYYRPDLDAPRHPGLLAAAARPFRSPGLAAPWYPALGNHDVLVQGETPPTDRIDAFATGTRLVTGLDPGLRPRADVDAARAVDALLADGGFGRSIAVPSDPRRRHLRPGELIERLAGRADAPAALRAARGRATLDYAFDAGAVRAIVLDTADRRGGSRGFLAPAQLDWLRAELRAAAGRPLLVFSHNPLDNTARGDRALAALDATPGVLAAIAGNSHRNRIRPRGGYWTISTSSLADHPQQARALRVRRTATGYALETWMLDHDGHGLAAPARELAYLDAQGGRPQGFAGGRGDRNARLFVAAR